MNMSDMLENNDRKWNKENYLSKNFQLQSAGWEIASVWTNIKNMVESNIDVADWLYFDYFLFS
jgi:hypothetical protein